VQNHNTLYQLGQPGRVNAVVLEEPLSAYEMMSALLVPMFAARAAEEAFYGPKGVTLSTSKEVHNLFLYSPPILLFVCNFSFSSHVFLSLSIL